MTKEEKERVPENNIVENGKVVFCEKCHSTRIFPVDNFDYVKQCDECGHQFSTGVHN
jgi:uncharacterized protein (DUF983 family)